METKSDLIEKLEKLKEVLADLDRFFFKKGLSKTVELIQIFFEIQLDILEVQKEILQTLQTQKEALELNKTKRNLTNPEK